MIEKNEPYFFIVKKGTFEPVSPSGTKVEALL